MGHQQTCTKEHHMFKHGFCQRFQGNRHATPAHSTGHGRPEHEAVGMITGMRL
jgi:hypothetical protein